MTDSGGVQKEAFFYRVPCVTLCSETEWKELVKMGWNRVVPPTTPENIKKEVLACIERKGEAGDPFGKGDASKKL